MLTSELINSCFKLFLEVKTKQESCRVNNSETCLAKYNRSLPKGFMYTLPCNLTLKLTPECNLRCKHCFYSENESAYIKKDILDYSELSALIDFFADEINILTIILTGGEPFLYPNIFDVIKKIKEKNIIITIQTNATLINELYAEKLSKILDLKNDRIDISLEGATEDSHDSIRGKGTFAKTINAIKLLRKYGINLKINTTMTSASATNLHEIFELCSSLDVKNLSINKFKICNEKHKYLDVKYEQIFECNYKILTEYQKYPDIKANIKTLNIYDFLKHPTGRILLDKFLEDFCKKDYYNPNLSENLSCHNHNRITIDSVGNVFLCSMDESSTGILGNLKTESFYDIWEKRKNHPYFQARNSLTTACKNCKYLILCNTGCMISAYKKYGNINMPTADCPYFEEYLRSKNG